MKDLVLSPTLISFNKSYSHSSELTDPQLRSWKNNPKCSKPSFVLYYLTSLNLTLPKFSCNTTDWSRLDVPHYTYYSCIRHALSNRVKSGLNSAHGTFSFNYLAGETWRHTLFSRKYLASQFFHFSTKDITLFFLANSYTGALRYFPICEDDQKFWRKVSKHVSCCLFYWDSKDSVYGESESDVPHTLQHVKHQKVRNLTT